MMRRNNLQPPRRPRTLSLPVVALATLLGTGCADLDAAGSPLDGARSSPEELAAAALLAIAAGDEDALAELMITRDEYESLLWPVLPDRHQMPFEFAWSVTGPRSRVARRRALQKYGGLPLELVRVELGDEVERYDEFALHRRSRMVVRRTDTGAEEVLPLMDTLVRMGGWKYMNYVDGG